MLILNRRLLMYLAQAVILLCQQRRKDGLPVGSDLADLRDELHQVATGGLELPPVEAVPVVAEAVAVDVREAARRLSVSERSVRRMVADGRLSTVRVGRRVLIPVAAISQLVEAT